MIRHRSIPLALFAGALGLSITIRAQTGAKRLTPAEIGALASRGAGTGTSGVAGIRTTILSGDPSSAGLYTIRLMVPPNTRIEAHTHRDARSATVVSGTWYLGYGRAFGEPALKALAPGSFYTEPAAEAHFAQTRSEAVVVDITGYGPSDTVYVAAAK